MSIFTNVIEFLSIIGNSIISFNNFLCSQISLPENPFLLSLFTTIEIYIVVHLLLFGKLKLKSFYSQGFFITIFSMGIVYYINYSVPVAVVALLLFTGLMFNNGTSKYTFADWGNDIRSGADSYTELKVAGALD